MTTYELNLDGLVGPTHHYAGLSAGNIASTRNALKPANPAAAALQGIKKMRLLHQLGVKQAVMPPHQRPNLDLLTQLGFTGTPAQQLRAAKRVAPDCLSACFSASSMWTANAATVSPSTDSADHRVHFTVANLINNLHRHQEAPFSYQLLKRLFDYPEWFVHHAPLPSALTTRDEGAANHNRLCRHHGESGLQLFVYNQQMLPFNNHSPKPRYFPARQTREASEAIARNHHLHPDRVLFAQQNPMVVDQGVFHNDVIAVANESVLLVHEDAFFNQQEVLQRLRECSPTPIQCLEVQRDLISVQDAVRCYLFNSQLVSLSDQSMALIAPIECEQHQGIKSFIDQLITAEDNPINAAHYLDLRQSMRNGGGPACLRLRVVLNEQELAAVHPGIMINDRLLNQLEHWVTKHYRTSLQASDLDDPALIDENYCALDELTQLLNLGSVYPFQSSL